jgi:hypothetical protein
MILCILYVYIYMTSRYIYIYIYIYKYIYIYIYIQTTYEVKGVPPDHIVPTGAIAGWNEGGFFEGEEGENRFLVFFVVIY